jgi:pimeloyl-ACP methyl ester carboxylesterase
MCPWDAMTYVTMSSRRGRSSSASLRQVLSVDYSLIRRCRRNGGCRVDCAHDRTDDSRLPWEADGYGGWGGHEYHGTEPGTERPPVVFVHGNQRDACDWEPHAEFFLNRSYGGDELWAISFGDASPTHPAMADQLEEFVTQVCAYTGAEQVSVVGHSLGVTGLRYWLAREDRYDRVDSFVGIAGANHGSELFGLAVRVGLTEGTYGVCRFLQDGPAGESPLAALNENETPGDVDYYTIRGTEDPLFMQRPESPALEGATNVALETDHDGARESLDSLELLYEWVADESPYNVRTFV